MLDEAAVARMDTGSAIRAMAPRRIQMSGRTAASHGGGTAAGSGSRCGTAVQGAGDRTSGRRCAAAVLDRSGRSARLGRTGDMAVSRTAGRGRRTAAALGSGTPLCGDRAGRAGRSDGAAAALTGGRGPLTADAGRGAGRRRAGRMRGRVTAVIIAAAGRPADGRTGPVLASIRTAGTAGARTGAAGRSAAVGTAGRAPVRRTAGRAAAVG